MKPDDLTRIRYDAKASAILSLQHDECLTHWDINYARLQDNAVDLGLALVRCPIRDFDINDMRRQLPFAISTLASLQAIGHRTYVHCTAGLGRSPLVVMSYLTLVENREPEEAMSMVLASRTDAAPPWEAYHGCRYDLVERHRKAIETRAYQLYEKSVNRSADEDWQQAEREVLCTVLLRPVETGTDCLNKT